MPDLPTPTSFATSWAATGPIDYGTYPVTAALALTSSSAGAVAGGAAVATLIADGVHVPTFDGQPNPHYSNVQGVQNVVALSCVGGVLRWSVGVSVPGATVVPRWAAVPSVANAAAGQPASIVGTALAATSYTYQWTLAGSPISGATGATYATNSGQVGSSLGCVVTAVNPAAPSGIPIAANPATIVLSDVLTFGSLDAQVAAGTSGPYQAITPSTSSGWGNSIGWSPSRKLQGSPASDVYYSITNPRTGCALAIQLAADKATRSGVFASPENPYAIYDGGSGAWTTYAGGFAGLGPSAATANGQVVRLRRTPANALFFETSGDGGSSWSSVASVANCGTADLFPRIQFGSNGVAGEACVVACNGAFD